MQSTTNYKKIHAKKHVFIEKDKIQPKKEDLKEVIHYKKQIFPRRRDNHE